ncbi:unnamed protein product, partial [marine sediment metagenome]
VGGSKILNDGLYSTSKMFPDDNYTFINPWITSCSYDKEHPRLEIRITIFDNNVKNHYDKLRKHYHFYQTILKHFI